MTLPLSMNGVKMKIVSTAIITLILTINLFAQNEDTEGTLVFNGLNFNNDEGAAIIYLFREKDDIPSKPFKTISAKIKDGKAKLVIENLPFGNYAAILYHDENANGILDHRFFMPAEPLTFTNSWEISLFSGLPDFEKLKFIFSADSSNQELRFK